MKQKTTVERRNGGAMTRCVRVVPFAVVILMAVACMRSVPLDAGLAVKSITDQNLARDVTVLASDEYEGRKPGTRGEDLTVAYLEKRFREIGLAPGNPNGSFVQPVPLLGIVATPSATVNIRGRKTALRSPDDFVARSLLNQGHTAVVESDVVFAGFGIEAPEYDWSDYEGVDVKGKTLLVLLGEPSRQAPADSAASDPSFFKGVEQTYYGTNRSKRDLAFKKGASAIVFLYGIGAPTTYQAIAPNYLTEALTINDGQPTMPVQAAMPAERVRPLVAMAGSDLDTLAQRAQQRGFRATPLDMAMSFDIVMQRRTIQSHNVIGRLEGSDPGLRNEYLIFSAHWDGFGRDPSVSGDQIRNGAIDNAGGVAQMLAIASALRTLPRSPRRTILFLATTAEEAGMLGTHYYTSNPLYPLERTLANVNFDNFYAYGRTADVINYGDGRSDLDDIIRDVLTTQSRRVVPDPFPAEGFYFRMDHLEFANMGVPAVSPSMGVDVIGKPPGFGKQQVDQYYTRDYHLPSDEVRPDWDYGGAVQDAQMSLLVGIRVAEADVWPQWKPGAEFKARRDKMLAGKTAR